MSASMSADLIVLARYRRNNNCSACMSVLGGNDLSSLVILQKIRTAYLHPLVPVQVKIRKVKEEQLVESFNLAENTSFHR